MPEAKLTESSTTSRRGGWWGIAFVVTLFVAAAMISLPTGRQTGRAIAAFYAAHTGVILVQQVLGVVTLAFFFAFALALGARRRRWLLVGTVLLAISEVITNIVPVILALTNPGPDGAHTWTVIEDLADEALFISIAVFSFAATIDEVGWIRAAGLVVAAIALLRVVLTLFGVAALDALAPIAFLILVLILSVRMFMGRSKSMPTSTAYS
jgi:hypothetical protein